MITVRRAKLDDAEAIAEIHVIAWQTAYKNILPKPFLDDLSVKKHIGKWKDAIKLSQSNARDGLFVAIDKKKICGFARCGPARDKELAGYGEIYALYVHPDRQRRGYGKALLEYSRSFFARKKLMRMCMWTLEKNIAAHRVYKKWGSQKKSGYSKEIKIGGTMLSENAYVWDE